MNYRELKLCKWCFFVRKKFRDTDYHPKCRGNNECQCKCREVNYELIPYENYHVVNLGLKQSMVL